MEIQWSLVFFAAFICWGAGTYMAAVAFREAFRASERIMGPSLVLSAIAVVIGAVASMTHLGHLGRIFGVLSNPSSGIFVEGLSSALLVVLVIVYLVAARRKASSAVLRALALVGIIPALVVTFAVGSSYLMVARPAWDVFALPLVSVTAALSMGAVTVLAINAFTAKSAAGDGEAKAAKAMGATTLALIVVQAVAVAVYVGAVAAAPFQDASRSAMRMVAGEEALLFWGAVVALGILVPLVVVLVQHKKSASVDAAGSVAAQSNAAVVLVVAALCMLVAVIAFRVIMFSLGSSIIDFGFTV